jgi:transcriptional regulator with XRE-family HTH domain
MKRLKNVPGVEDHLNKFSVIMGKKILKRRLELGMTQQKVVQLIKEKGGTMTQARLSKIECGDDSITANTYNKVLDALGGLDDITPEFKENPNSKELLISN